MSQAAAAPLPSGRFEGREAFRQLVRDGLARAAQEGWRELILSDASFEEWPLGERAVPLVPQPRDFRPQARDFVFLLGHGEIIPRHGRAGRRHRGACGVRGATPGSFLPLGWNNGGTGRRRDAGGAVPNHCLSGIAIALVAALGACTPAPGGPTPFVI